MTVRQWIERRSPTAPASLIRQVVAALGADGDADEARTGTACVTAAARALRDLVSAQRFAREDALELLGIDALMTYAYEHAAESGGSVRPLAERGSLLMGQLS